MSPLYLRVTYKPVPSSIRRRNLPSTEVVTRGIWSEATTDVAATRLGTRPSAKVRRKVGDRMVGKLQLDRSRVCDEKSRWIDVG